MTFLGLYRPPGVYTNVCTAQVVPASPQHHTLTHTHTASSQGPAQKSGKGPGSASVHFLSTITASNFEEPIGLQNETTRNVIPSHEHKAKSADYGDMIE